jgi:hypothetical protein
LKARYPLPLAILVGVVVRVPFWSEALRTPLDGDTAIVGLMARHPGAGTTMWGQPYGSPLEAWLAAPLVALFGTTPEALRLLYFLLGLALIPLAYALAGTLHPKAALPAAFLMACPPPYFLLLSSLPPPMYPSALLLGGLVLLLALRLGDRLSAGERPRVGLAAWGSVAGLALWTHVMSVPVVACAAVHLFARARGRRSLLAVAAVATAVTSAPAWGRALTDPQGLRVVGVSSRQETFVGHLLDVLPRLHEPVGGVLGTHVPVVADDPGHVVYAPPPVAAAVALVYGIALVFAVRRSGATRGVRLLLLAAAATIAVFPFPVRSSPSSIRFLTPLYLPLIAVLTWTPAAREGTRRAWVVVLILASLHLTVGSRMLTVWRFQDRTASPFLLPDLRPARQALEAHGIRRAYASYGPAYRLTYETGERIIASQPWNERFLHYPLPYLDEVRFATNVAWILTPAVPSDLPSPQAFESALAAAGGAWRKIEAGDAVVYHGFTPPYGPLVQPLAGAGLAGDGDLATALRPPPSDPLTLTLPVPTPLDGLTLVAPADGLRLPRSLDVEVSADGAAFETVARRRRRGEREDLRWVNGHPQYVLDHDVLGIPLGGRTVAAVRLTPIASSDAWALADVLLHPAAGPSPPWQDWLSPDLSWPARRRALESAPRHDREDWYSRLLLASRRAPP